MGLLDSILGSEKKETTMATGSSMNPFSVTVSFSPLRLSANKKNTVHMVVKIKNISGENQLVSVDALLPRDCMLGFDQAGINKVVEKKMGDVGAGENIDIPIEVWANNQTKAGSYPIEVRVYAHYIGYDKVVSHIKKSAALRVA
ncbi:hypothetical protein HZC07_01430 [Candidatus Micrarchaeota archaeon]|nr:hypothetical protein [Candidatus Micrarchaeota archaeon]